MSSKESVLPLKLTSLTPLTKPFLSTSPGLIANVGQLGKSRNLNKFLYHQNLILTDSEHLSKTLTTLTTKPDTPFRPLMNPSWKPNRNLAPFIFFSVRGNVTESAIIATIL